MKLFIANTLVKWFKRLPFCGRQRFWILYWAYRLTGWHIRHKEWDFVLDYLPPLGKWQRVFILDVGCSRNLLCHEIIARNYILNGIDLEEPDFEYPVGFGKADIRHWSYPGRYDFITCISVFEHIEGEDGQKRALRNMIESLKIGGRLILTIPTHEFSQGHPWHGFTTAEINFILNLFMTDKSNGNILAQITHAEERAGQHCICIERVA